MKIHDAEARDHKGALEMGSLSYDDTGEDLHLDAILELDCVDAEAVRKAGLKVVVDCVEGAGGRALPLLLERMGVEVVKLYCDRSGRFPHDPEPRPDHLGELCERVASEGADLGLAVDPDVDRLALVDRGGVALSEEITLAVAADYVLEATKGSMAVNLSTTLLIDRVAKKHGVPLFRTPVGEANVVAKMLSEGSVVGGEGNGGVILPAHHPGRDALLGAAIVVSAVAKRGSLSACREDFPPVAMVKDKLELEASIDDPSLWEKALRSLSDSGQMDSQDGLKYDLGDSWVHMRRSNTENALRIIAEAGSIEAAQKLIGAIRVHLGV